MAVVTQATTGRQIETSHGLQVRQYRDQLHRAGMLNTVIRATGAERSRLTHCAGKLIEHLRVGMVNEETKQVGKQLGLIITPNGVNPKTKGLQSWLY